MRKISLVSVQVKVESEQKNRWSDAAHDARKTLSGWIRKVCDEASQAPGRGYTLVEILVVLSIIVVMAGVGIPAFVWMTGEDIKSEALDLYGALHLAKTLALIEHRDVAVVYILRDREIEGYGIAKRITDDEFAALLMKWKDKGHPLDPNRTYYTLVQEQEVGGSLHNPFVFIGRMTQFTARYWVRMGPRYLPVRMHADDGVLMQPYESFEKHDDDTLDIRTDYRNFRWPATVFTKEGRVKISDEKQRMLIKVESREPDDESPVTIQVQLSTGRVKIGE